MSPRRRLLILVTALVILVLGVGAAFAVRDDDDKPTRSTVAQDVPGTVLLVPGYGGGTSGLEVLATKLRAQGRTAVVVKSVGDGTGDLRAQAAAVKTAADAALSAGAPSVDVVGYSAGGVVARIWADDLGGADIARRIVTLGAPHHGTQIAALGAALAPAQCPLACQQLVPNSDLLRSLAETVPGPVYTALYTQQDEVVTPPASGRLAGAVTIDLQQVCADEVVSHGGLPTNPLVTGIVEQALAVAPLSAPPAASACGALRGAGSR